MDDKQKKGVMLAVLGLIIAVLCVKADGIGLGNSPGQGVQQWIGTFIGAIIILIGTYLINLSGKALLIIGIILALPALVADQIGLGSGSGFGLKQSTIFLIGVVSSLMGIIKIKRERSLSSHV